MSTTRILWACGSGSHARARLDWAKAVTADLRSPVVIGTVVDGGDLGLDALATKARDADLVIADFSTDDGPLSVEAVTAATLGRHCAGKPTYLLTTSVGSVPFDWRRIPNFVVPTGIEGREPLQNWFRRLATTALPERSPRLAHRSESKPPNVFLAMPFQGYIPRALPSSAAFDFTRIHDEILAAIESIEEGPRPHLTIVGEGRVGDDIFDDIKRMLEHASVVVADLSPDEESRPVPNPNVVTEATIARMALNHGNTLLVLAQAGSELPAMWATFRTVFYEPTTLACPAFAGRSLRDVLGEQIAAALAPPAAPSAAGDRRPGGPDLSQLASPTGIIEFDRNGQSRLRDVVTSVIDALAKSPAPSRTFFAPPKAERQLIDQYLAQARSHLDRAMTELGKDGGDAAVVHLGEALDQVCRASAVEPSNPQAADTKVLLEAELGGIVHEEHALSDVRWAATSPDGKTVSVAAAEGIHVFTIEHQPRLLARISEASNGGAYLDDDTLVVTRGYEVATIAIKTGESRVVLDSKAVGFAPYLVRHPGRGRIALAFSDGKGYPQTKVFRRVEDIGSSVAFEMAPTVAMAPAGRHIAVRHLDGGLHLYREDGSLLWAAQTTSTSDNAPPHVIDDQAVVLDARGTDLVARAVDTGDEVGRLKGAVAPYAATCVARRPGSNVLVAAGAHWIAVWSLAEGIATRRCELLSRQGTFSRCRNVHALAMLPDGRHFLAVVNNGPSLVRFALPRRQWDT